MRLFRFLVYSNLYVALILSTLSASSYFLVPQLKEFRWYVPTSIFLASFALYSFHRLYKIDFIPENQLSDRHRWILKHSNIIKIAMSIAVFFGMTILPFFDSVDVVWLIPAAILSIGYTIPLIPTEKKWWRLRDIPLAKPVIIAFCVTYLTLAFPIFDELGINEIFELYSQQIFLERFLFLLAVTIPFEMRDMETDALAHLDTLATKFGFKTSKKIALAAAITWFVILVCRFAFLGQWVKLWPFCLVLILLLLAIQNLHNKRSEFYYVLCFEGMILLYSSSYILLQILA